MNKNERIRQIEIGAILENSQEQLSHIQSDLEKLTPPNNEITRISHNVGVIIAHLETAIQKILEGGRQM